MSTYNAVAPRLVVNNGGSLENFRDLTFGESDYNFSKQLILLDFISK